MTLFRGYDGPFHVDLAGPNLLDVNPRSHASLPVAVAAGVNIVSLYCGLLRGARPIQVRGHAGLRCRWLEGDVRSVLWSARSGSLSPWAALFALAPRRGTVHSFGSMRDPGRAIARLRFAVRRFRRGRTR